jgi:hypothetical protein
MAGAISQIRSNCGTLAAKGIHPLKWIAFSSGVRSGVLTQRSGMPRWVGEHECDARIDEEEHWWWMRGFDVGYYNRDPAEEMSKLLRPQHQ